MRVLMLVQQYYPFRVGSALLFQALAEHLAAKGHQVTVYTSDAFGSRIFFERRGRRVRPLTEVHEGVRVRRFPVRHLPGGVRALKLLRLALPFAWAKCVFAIPFLPGLLKEALRGREQYDLVVGGILPYGGLLWSAWRIARRCGAPLAVVPVLHLGEPADPRVRLIHSDPPQIELVRRAACVFALTGLERDELVRLGVAAERVHVIGVSVDPVAVRSGRGERFRNRYGLHGPIIYYIGTRAYEKGTFHLVRAMQQIWDKGIGAHLVLAGSSSMPDFDRFFAALPPAVRGRILIMDDMSEEEKRDLLAAGDVLVMPSRNDAFGTVYLEAWSCGAPVIGAFAGGVPDVIDDGKDGFLVPFGNVPMMAEYIIKLINDPDLRRMMGERGRRKVEQRFSRERWLARVTAPLESLLAEHRPATAARR